MKNNNVKRGFRFREKFVAASLLISIIAFVLLRYYLKDNKEYAWLVFFITTCCSICYWIKEDYNFLFFLSYYCIFNFGIYL